RQVYTRMFLRTMKPKALAKLQQYPDLFSRERLVGARDLHAFDEVFTGPLHGFRGADDYWRRASAKPVLARVQVPTLLINPLNDPFVPAYSLPGRQDVSPMVTLWQPRHGGHVGFAAGQWPGHVRGLADQVGQWLLHAATQHKELVNG
ncbi:MAG: alpha/beta hydrolase, partial [Limnohabitans sp.]